MEINNIYSGFKLIQNKYISDIGSMMYVFKHLKSGCELVYLENDDTNKCFAAGFRTLPEDSTGICHIIEHSVLCGSKKYPLKEPFVNLLKGSMATFLNAMTASDWTMYPVASQNDKDFENLMDVYLDAVFNPLSIIDEKPFLQEGWHLEMTDENSVPSYKGVVYNEMKGAMSSVYRVLDEEVHKNLYAGTCYEFNSGGSPADIPNLTYDYYKEFYQKHYHPENCLMYLYGKMDILERLNYIDQEYLSNYVSTGLHLEATKANQVVNLDIVGEYEIGEDEPLTNNSYFALGFVLDDYSNALDLIGMDILNEALMATNDSPLKKALLDLKIGEDISSMLDDDNIQPGYYISVEKADPQDRMRFYEQFMNECQKLITNGINKEDLLAVINNQEFKRKEMDMGRMPKGLFFAFNLMQCFNYYLPYEKYLEYSKYFDFYKRELNNGYFEGLIEKYILNSKHHVLVTLNPNKELGSQKEAQMKEKMQELFNNMSDDEKSFFVKQTADLFIYQSRKDSKEELDTLPKLKLSDISTAVNTLETKYEKKNFEILKHEFNTNGIAYLNMYFDLSCLKMEELLYAKLLALVLLQLDTKNYDANRLQSHIKTYLGDFSFGILTAGRSKDEYVIRFNVGLSSLDENIDKMMIFDEVINSTIFDGEKIRIILQQIKNRCRTGIIQNGMDVVIETARKSQSALGAIQAKLGVYDSYLELNNILENYNEDKVIESLRNVSKKIFNINNLCASVSGNRETLEKLVDLVSSFNLGDEKLPKALEPQLKGEGQAIIIPSGVNYNGRASNISSLGVEKNGSLNVCAHIINFDYLWPEVRVKGGAYGCSMMVADNGDIAFGSYRDPNVENTFKAYDGVKEYLDNFNPDEDEFMGYLVGAIGAFDKPASNSRRIASADVNFFKGVKDEDRIAFKKQMLETKILDVKAYAEMFEKMKNSDNYTIGNETKIKEFNGFKNIKNL